MATQVFVIGAPTYSSETTTHRSVSWDRGNHLIDPDFVADGGTAYIGFLSLTSRIFSGAAQAHPVLYIASLMNDHGGSGDAGPHLTSALLQSPTAIRIEAGSLSLTLAGPDYSGNQTQDDAEPYAWRPSNENEIWEFLHEYLSLAEEELADTRLILTDSTNQPPVANAGTDQSVQGGVTVTLDGSGSSDPDTGDSVASYYWRQIDGGHDVVLANPTTADPTFTAPSYRTSSALEFRVTVKDQSGASTSDEVTVNVAATFLDPIADAGPDQPVEAGTLVTLDARRSVDPDGYIRSFAWTQVSGSNVTLLGASTWTPSFEAPISNTESVLVFRVTVTDDHDRTDTDEVTITVAVGTASPILTAGPYSGQLGRPSLKSTPHRVELDPRPELPASIVQGSDPVYLHRFGVDWRLTSSGSSPLDIYLDLTTQQTGAVTTYDGRLSHTFRTSGAIRFRVEADPQYELLLTGDMLGSTDLSFYPFWAVEGNSYVLRFYKTSVSTSEMASYINELFLEYMRDALTDGNRGLSIEFLPEAPPDPPDLPEGFSFAGPYDLGEPSINGRIITYKPATFAGPIFPKFVHRGRRAYIHYMKVYTNNDRDQPSLYLTAFEENHSIIDPGDRVDLDPDFLSAAALTLRAAYDPRELFALIELSESDTTDPYQWRLTTSQASAIAQLVSHVAGLPAGQRGMFLEFLAGPPEAPRKPAKITTLTSMPGNGQFTLNWLPPNDNGSPITHYEVAGIPGYTRSSPLNVGLVNHYTATGVTNGNEYSPQVRAVNAVDAGLWSGVARSFPGAIPPGIISGVQLSVTDQLIIVRFPTPYSGTSSIDHYQYQIGDGPWNAFGTVTDPDNPTLEYATIGSLINGQQYDLRFRVVARAGTGPPSAVYSAVPALSAAPNQVTGVSLTPGATTITIRWTPPPTASTSSLTQYQYRLNGGGWVFCGSNIDEYTILGLVTGETYAVEVRAVNNTGPGPASHPVSITLAETPEAPNLYQADPGDGQVELAWAEPDNGGSEITDYHLRIDGGAWLSLGSTALTHTVTNLTNDTEYSFEIRAVNVIGSGSASSPLSATPVATDPPPSTEPTVPAKVTQVTVTPGDQMFRVSVTLPANGGAGINDVQYRIDGGTWEWSPKYEGANVVFNQAALFEYEIDGLSNGVSFEVEFRAVNFVGPGPASDIVTVTPTAAAAPDSPTGDPDTATIRPGQITGVRLEILTATSVRLHLALPTSGGAVESLQYKLGAGDWTDLTGTGTSHDLSGLTAESLVVVMVRAKNPIGPGLESPYAGVRLPAGTPYQAPL